MFATQFTQQGRAASQSASDRRRSCSSSSPTDPVASHRSDCATQRLGQRVWRPDRAGIISPSQNVDVDGGAVHDCQEVQRGSTKYDDRTRLLRVGEPLAEGHQRRLDGGTSLEFHVRLDVAALDSIVSSKRLYNTVFGARQGSHNASSIPLELAPGTAPNSPIAVKEKTPSSAVTGSGATNSEQWAWVELNYRPHAYQACALTT